MLDFLMLLVMIESKENKNKIFFLIFNFDFRQAWISLGDMSKEKAMEEYIKLLLNHCSIFRIYLENQHTENEEKYRSR
jgi:hypothetical protein